MSFPRDNLAAVHEPRSTGDVPRGMNKGCEKRAIEELEELAEPRNVMNEHVLENKIKQKKFFLI